jgi:hypothetical protein
LQGFSYLANNLAQARKSFCLAVGYPTLSNRFLYALGGRNATDLLNSIETASVDNFGNVGLWHALTPFPMPSGEMGCNVIGSFLYLVGGRQLLNGTEVASNITYRAKILDPLATPSLQIGIQLNSSQTGLPGGLWFYSVSANFGPSYTINPNGESLPGTISSLNLPNPVGLSVALSWDTIPNAISYSLYRNSIPGDITSLKRVVTLVGTSFVDNNSILPTGNTPLAPGALGNWWIVPAPLNSPRYLHASTKSPSQLNKNTFHMYSIGGRLPDGSYSNTMEFINVTIVPPVLPKDSEDHMITTWMMSLATLQAPRSDLSAFTIGNEEFASITGPTRWLFVGVGETTGATMSSQLDAQAIGLNGDVSGPFSAYAANLGGPTQGNAGICWLFDSSNLIISGGLQSGTPTSSGSSAKLCSASGGGCPVGPYPPSNGNFNSNGNGAFKEARYQGRCVLDTAFIFAMGGQNTVGVSNTVERSLA